METSDSIVQEQILKYLERGAGSTVREIAVHIGTSPSHALNHLYALAREHRAIYSTLGDLWKKP